MAKSKHNEISKYTISIRNRVIFILIAIISKYQYWNFIYFSSIFFFSFL